MKSEELVYVKLNRKMTWGGGVTIKYNMNVPEQCRIAASQVNQIRRMIRKNITYKDKGLIVSLYKAIYIYTPLRILYAGMEAISQEVGPTYILQNTKESN